MPSDSASAAATTPDDDATLPLVSVLVRSVDREFLAQALASVAAQTYPRLELVVVAVGPDHSELPPAIGPVPVRLITADRLRPRSRAANVGLEQARGQWLLFLDDDDWLMPDHVARLHGALGGAAAALAAYTGVALVDRDGRPRGTVLDLPFDAVRQRAGNLTPIHAVLFSRSLLERGCRFDESLDRYEDWDFWLQLARQTVFVHLPGVSAVYRIHDSSGVHDDAGPLGAASRRIYDKWAGIWSPQEIGEIMRRVWSHDEVESRLADSERRHAEVSARAEADHARAEAERARAGADRDRAAAAEAALNARLDQQAAALHGQAHRIGLLQNQLQHQQQLAEQQHALAVEQQAIAHQQAQSIGQLGRQLADTTFRLEQATTDLRAMLDSSSWRLTRPLRWLSDKLGRHHRS